MKKTLLAALLLASVTGRAERQEILSPNGQLRVEVSDTGGKVNYSIELNGKTMLRPSALGFKADFGDFTQGLKMVAAKTTKVDESYEMRQVKQRLISYTATRADLEFENEAGQCMTIQFSVADNDVAFRYLVPRQQKNNPKTAVIEYELSAFQLPAATTTFLSPQSKAMVGWERTKPSYEEEYEPDAPMTAPSKYGKGYTFPCLFHLPDNDGWVLLSETGVTSQYCGARISDYSATDGYVIAYPMEGENNGIGSTKPAIPLPGATPWRTITVGQTLKPIVETTVMYDLVEPLYEPSEVYQPGRYTWSWLIWQDESINWDDQIKFIDLAAAMGYEYCLVDGCWDTEIGRDRMPALADYARQKGVALMLWYNSNGAENDAPQTPRGRMDTSIQRDREMAWLKEIGVKGIKVDFFGGDKQLTMKLYEDILYDANRYGLQCIFHGCTLPRGWERMYPNYVSSEAVLASENVFFSEHHAKEEPFQLTMHPFCRNAAGAMDWGGVIMNRFMSKNNRKRHQRFTTNTFELATGITNQAAIQCVAIQPNNLDELNPTELSFLRELPTTWDETRFIDGYPGRYVVLARRHGDTWYVAGLNALKEPLKLTLQLPMMASGRASLFSDDKDGSTVKTPLKINKKQMTTVTLQPGGGFIAVSNE